MSKVIPYRSGIYQAEVDDNGPSLVIQNPFGFRFGLYLEADYEFKLGESWDYIHFEVRKENRESGETKRLHWISFDFPLVIGDARIIRDWLNGVLEMYDYEPPEEEDIND